MSLTRVLVSESLVGSLMTQAMVSPSHESMALLLGRYEPSPGAEEGAIERDPPAVRIVTTALFPRHDRTATRVEFSAEALAAGVAEAEALAAASGDRSLRVVGWFHTHPSITIHPSHVDLRTQGECQGMGRGFVGLIASVFTASAAPCGRQALLTAFQSTKVGGTWERREVPLVVTRAGDQPPAVAPQSSWAASQLRPAGADAPARCVARAAGGGGAPAAGKDGGSTGQAEPRVGAEAASGGGGADCSATAGRRDRFLDSATSHFRGSAVSEARCRELQLVDVALRECMPDWVGRAGGDGAVSGSNRGSQGWARVAAAGDALRALAGSGAQLRVLGTAVSAQASRARAFAAAKARCSAGSDAGEPAEPERKPAPQLRLVMAPGRPADSDSWVPASSLRPPAARGSAAAGGSDLVRGTSGRGSGGGGGSPRPGSDVPLGTATAPGSGVVDGATRVAPPPGMEGRGLAPSRPSAAAPGWSSAAPPSAPSSTPVRLPDGARAAMPLLPEVARQAVQLAAEDMEAATRSPGSVDAFMSQAHWGVLVLRAFLGLSTDVVPALLRLERVAGSGWHLLYRRVALPALPPAVPAQLGWEAMTTSFATEEADASRTGAGWASGGLVTELADASADILRKRRLPRAPSAAPWLLRREEPLFVSFSAAGLPGGSAVAQVSAHDYVRFLAWGAPTVAADLETGP